MVIALLLAAVTTPASQSAASTAQASGTRQPLSAWIDRYFARVNDGCRIKLKPAKNASVAPGDVQSWPIVQTHLSNTVIVDEQSSVDHVFSTVHRRDGANFSDVGSPLGVTWSSAAGPILYAQSDQARRQHNCVTLLATRGDAKLGLSIAQIQGALSSAYDTSGTLTSFLYAGTMISPITASLGLNTTVTARPSGIAPFSVLMAIWDWYRVQPQFIADGEARRLEILDTIEGVAVQTVTGLTQKMMMEASARASVGIPFFSASAGADGNLVRNVNVQIQEFSVARWNVRPAYLPSATKVAQDASRLAVFRSAAGNPTGVDGTASFDFAFDLLSLPSAYCNMTFWQASQPAGSQGAPTLTSASPVEGDPTTCRFIVQVTPPQKAAAGISVPFAIRSVASGADAKGPAPTLVLTANTATVADYRSSFALEAPSGPKQVTFASGGASTQSLVLNFPIRENTPNRSVLGVQPSSTTAVFSCGRMRTIRPAVASAFQRNDSQAVLSMTLTFDSAGIEGTQTCQASGFTSLRSSAGGSTQVSIPSFDVLIVGPPAAATQSN